LASSPRVWYRVAAARPVRPEGRARTESWFTIMPAPSRRPAPGSDPPRSPPSSPTTADATPTLAAALRAIPAGPALDGMVAAALHRLGQPLPPAGLSTTWEGMGRLMAALTALGCYLETQAHADRCLCRVSRVLKGNAIAKQLASGEAPAAPEAVARAAILACLEMEPPAA
jgi:hypothetical protein